MIACIQTKLSFFKVDFCLDVRVTFEAPAITKPKQDQKLCLTKNRGGEKCFRS